MVKFFFLRKYMIPRHLLPVREGISTYVTVLLVSTDNKVEASCFEVMNDNWSEDGLNWKQNWLDVLGLLPPQYPFFINPHMENMVLVNGNRAYDLLSKYPANKNSRAIFGWRNTCDIDMTVRMILVRHSFTNNVTNKRKRKIFFSP